MKNIILFLVLGCTSLMQIQAQDLTHFQIDDKFIVDHVTEVQGTEVSFYSKLHGGVVLLKAKKPSEIGNMRVVMDKVPAFVLNNETRAVDFMGAAEFGAARFTAELENGEHFISFDFKLGQAEAVKCLLYKVSGQERELVKEIMPSTYEWSTEHISNLANSCDRYELDILSSEGHQYTMHADINQEPEIEILPNPSTSQTNIVIPVSCIGSDLRVYDMMGRLIWQACADQLVNRVDASSWPSGSYIVNIGEGTEGKIFIKQ